MRDGPATALELVDAVADLRTYPGGMPHAPSCGRADEARGAYRDALASGSSIQQAGHLERRVADLR